MTRRVEIVVDELVLCGVAPETARVAAAALETRLAALAEGAKGPLPERAESFRRPAPVTVLAGRPAALGDAVAGAVWSAVSGRGDT